MKDPKWVFLDLDNTLWDFDGNAEEALRVLFDRHNLALRSTQSVEHFISLYKSINDAYWRSYERGEIDKNYLRSARFTDTFIQMGIPLKDHPENIWEEYLEICPYMTKMVTGALNTVKLLHRNAKLAIITNGFASTQTIKIKNSGLEPFINFVINSEDAGVAKPQSKIFNLAVGASNTEKAECLYIGDTLQTDVWGAINAGIRVIWFNPHRQPVSGELADSEYFLTEVHNHLQLLAFVRDQWGWI